jgi:hypothetical protein
MKPLPDHRVKSVPRRPPRYSLLVVDRTCPFRPTKHIATPSALPYRPAPTAHESPASHIGFGRVQTGPLEAGVVVLVPVLVGRTRMQLCHGARPLSSLHPGLPGVVGLTEPTYTSIGTRVLPRAQGLQNALSGHRPNMSGHRPEHICDIIPGWARADRGAGPCRLCFKTATTTAEPELCQALFSSTKMTGMIKALLIFGDLPRQVRLHRRPSGRLQH